MAALLLAFTSTHPLSVVALETRPAPEVTTAQSELPELGIPSQAGSTSIMPGPSGITAQSRFDGTKITVTPEFSNQTGASLGLALATMLGDQAAVGILLTAGADKRELLLNAGFKLDQSQRIILTVGQLKQYLDYNFLSGTEKTGIAQNGGGVSYQLQLGNEFLRFLEVNGYFSKAASRDLADKTFAIDSATLYELWNDPRRIAGGQVSGLQGKLGFSPIDGSTVKVSFGYEHLSYDLLAAKDIVNRPTGGLEWLQKIGNGYLLKLAAETFAAQQRYSAGIERNIADSTVSRHNIGLNFIGSQGRDGLGNDNQFQLTYSYIFGASLRTTPSRSAAANAEQTLGLTEQNLFGNNRQPSAGLAGVTASNLLDQVAMRPGYLPSQVLAKVDKTALPTRLIAIDKTAIPTGSSVNPVTGDLLVPIGVAVTGIASITRNLATSSNTGQFSLSGNSLLIRPSQIIPPIAGTTQAKIVISHGSVKIDSITISTADSLPPGYIQQGGLTWMPNSIVPSMNWSTANTYCTTETINGQTGWRLPTKNELLSLYKSGALAGQGWTLGYT